MGRKYWKIIEFFLKPLIFFLKLCPKCIIRLLYDFSSSIPTPVGLILRYCLLASKVNYIGSNVYIARWVTIKNMSGLTIGDNVSIHENCYIDAIGGVDIGSEVSIAHNSSIISFEHAWNDSATPIKYNSLVLKKISIAKDVWIGCGVRVLGGTIINTRCVIGAGSVVKGELIAKSVYGGIPAKKIMEFNND